MLPELKEKNTKKQKNYCGFEEGTLLRTSRNFANWKFFILQLIIWQNKISFPYNQYQLNSVLLCCKNNFFYWTFPQAKLVARNSYFILLMNSQWSKSFVNKLFNRKFMYCVWEISINCYNQKFDWFLHKFVFWTFAFRDIFECQKVCEVASSVWNSNGSFGSLVSKFLSAVFWLSEGSTLESWAHKYKESITKNVKIRAKSVGRNLTLKNLQFPTFMLKVWTSLKASNRKYRFNIQNSFKHHAVNDDYDSFLRTATSDKHNNTKISFQKYNLARQIIRDYRD